MVKRLYVAALAASITSLTAMPASAMNASFRWCSRSPEFQISGVPKGTATLDLQMMDQMAPAYRHGGGKVAFTGQKSIPCGGLSGSYEGPSPTPNQVHTYQWTIKALDGSGKVLDQTIVQRKFPE